MASIKIERLNHAIQQEISIILMREIKDEEIKFVTITGVDTTNDLSYATVYYTVLDESNKEKTEENVVVCNANNPNRPLFSEETTRKIMNHINDDEIV